MGRVMSRWNISADVSIPRHHPRHILKWSNEVGSLSHYLQVFFASKRCLFWLECPITETKRIGPLGSMKPSRSELLAWCHSFRPWTLQLVVWRSPFGNPKRPKTWVPKAPKYGCITTRWWWFQPTHLKKIYAQVKLYHVDVPCKSTYQELRKSLLTPRIFCWRSFYGFYGVKKNPPILLTRCIRRILIDRWWLFTNPFEKNMRKSNWIIFAWDFIKPCLSCHQLLSWKLYPPNKWTNVLDFRNTLFIEHVIFQASTFRGYHQLSGDIINFQGLCWFHRGGDLSAWSDLVCWMS